MGIRRLAGLILMLAGLGGVAAGIGLAVSEIRTLYTGALERPLDEPTGGGEQGASDRILRAAGIGAVGAAPFIIGTRLMRVRRRG